MMYVIILGVIGIVGIILYCCNAITTPYDRKVNDTMQEAFLQQYKKK